MRQLLSAVLMATALVGSTASVAVAEGPVPQTVEDHEKLAKTYEEKAAQYQKEAQYHRDMLADVKKAQPETTKRGKSPEVAKMEQHCNALIKDAEKMAADAQKAADYHHHRAQEMQGK